MQPLNFEQSVKKIVAADPRYNAEAYHFVRESLDYTRRSSGRQRNDTRDVGSKELLDGLRRYGLETYGPMTITVLAEWGVTTCEDFGEIVFNMIAHNCERKSDTDNREDFKNGFGFEEAFRRPFLPTVQPVAQPAAVAV
jgi:uncharacterized repeat protein (TIGR04138 family)